MITVQQKTGVLAGAILTVAAISMPAHAQTTYNTNFTAFGSGGTFNITGTATYTGAIPLNNLLQDITVADVNADFTYDWDVAYDVNLGGVQTTGSFDLTDANSDWRTNFDPSFAISSNLFVLKPLVASNFAQIFEGPLGSPINSLRFEGPTTSASGDGNVSYILGKAPKPIPTPALLPGLLGFGASIARRKKQQAEAAA